LRKYRAYLLRSEKRKIKIIQKLMPEITIGNILVEMLLVISYMAFFKNR
jgi:hypothetical protein